MRVAQVIQQGPCSQWLARCDVIILEAYRVTQKKIAQLIRMMKIGVADARDVLSLIYPEEMGRHTRNPSRYISANVPRCKRQEQ